jgi:aminoglycoside 2'-N-acetyltransferase I
MARTVSRASRGKVVNGQVGTPVDVGVAGGDDDGTSAHATAATISPHRATSAHRPRRLTQAPFADYIITRWRAVSGRPRRGWHSGPVTDVRVAESGELDEHELADAEALVRTAFGAGFRSHDWLHGVDGAHVVVSENAVLLAHATVVARTLGHDGRDFDTGYVEAVAVREGHQGRGLGRLVMDHAETLIRARHDIGALNAVQSAVAFYAGRGWTPWHGPTMADTPAGLVDTYDTADRILLFPTSSSEPSEFAETVPLVCDWRVGDLW